MSGQGSITVLKLGGSVITNRKDEHPRLRRRLLSRIAREIADGWRAREFRLVVVHGAGSFGHPIVHRTGIARGLHDESQRVAMGETQRLQSRLNAEVVHYLLRAGLPAFPYQPSASAVMEAGHLVSLDTHALEGLIGNGLVPVLNGVPAYDRIQGCSILSGDQIAGFLYSRLGAERILHGTNVKGIYDSDPSQDPEARFFPEIKLDPSTGLPAGVAGSSVTDVTGGMHKKLEEMRKVRAKGRVFDATIKGNVFRALSGEPVGTRVDVG